jgi:hypothetical protein
MSNPRSCLLIMTLGALGTPALAGAQQFTAPASASDLNACAAIPAQAERLTCYDKLAGRGTAPVASTPPSANAPAATAASSGSQPSPTQRSSAPTPSGPRPSSAASSSAPGSASSEAAAAASTASPTVVPREAFGLYKEEHPVAATSQIKAITAKVAGISHDPYGRETISLDEGALWQLDGSDALLASGDSVTIKRAALGSYVLTTPSGRTHRVRRLR